MPSIGLGSKITSVLAQAGFGSSRQILVGDAPIDCMNAARANHKNGDSSTQAENIRPFAELNAPLLGRRASRHSSVELRSSEPDLDNAPKSNLDSERISLVDFESTISPEHVHTTLPEPIIENDGEEECPASSYSQASTSLFTTASDREDEERKKWLDHMKGCLSSPASGCATPRGATDRFSQETVSITPINYIQRTLAGGTNTTDPPTRGELSAAAGSCGNKAQSIVFPTCGTPISLPALTNANASKAKNRLKRNRPRTEQDIVPCVKSRLAQSSQDWLPNSQQFKDRVYEQTFGFEARAKACCVPIEDDPEERVYPSSTPE